MKIVYPVPMKKKFTIVLTGGIGCGKSTVAKLFAASGIDIFDADEIARELVTPGCENLEKIKAYFGDNIVTAVGELDRAKLREIIFNDHSKRQWLENLLHPLIFAKIQLQAEKSHSQYCIAVIPLLFETNYHFKFDRILAIDSPMSLQIHRTLTRDQLAKANILKIMQAQVPRFMRLQKADDVLLNDGTYFNLQRQVNMLHEKYCKLAESLN